MKNKYILSAVLVTLFASVAANAQQGFGTNNPDPSSVIDMVSAKRGVLIPRVALTATNLATPVTAPAEALLVYNEATAGADPYEVKPGFYYWSVNRWIRITNTEDILKGTISSTDLTVTGGTDATFKNVTLDIKDGAITTDKIASEAVTEDKMKAPEITGTAIIRIPIAQNDGTVAYGPFPAAGVVGDNLTAAADTVESIEVVTGGTGAVLVPTSLRVKDGGITEVKLADGAVTTAKIGADAVTNAKLADDAVQTENIAAGAVETSDLASDAVTNAKLADNAVQTENIAAGAVETSDIKDAAVTAVKLADDAVTAAKIDSSVAGTGLKQNTTNGSLEVDAASFDGDITSTDLTVTGGDNATFTDVTLDIKADAVTNAKLADNAVQTENIAAGAVETSDIKDAAVTTVKIEDAAVTAVKLADDAVTAAKIDSSVAGTGLKQNTTNGSLEVDAASFDGDITSTDLTVTGGDNATFTDVTLDIKADAVTNAKLADNAVQTENIKDGNVTSAKLTAGAGTADRIAIADAAGAVTFSNAIPSGSIAGKDLTAGDGSISIGGTGAGALLKDANVSVATGGITEVKLADGAVTTAKIGADAVTNAKLADNAVQTENIAAGAVETSDIKDVAVTAVKLADDAVTAAKIDSSVAGTGLKQNTTNGSLEVDAASFDGDITSTDLTVTGGDNATFTDVTLNIKDGAVTTDKIKDENVTAAKLTAGTGVADRIAIADAAGAVTFSNAIPSGSIAGEDLTAGDGSISIGGTGAGALLKDANVSVATGGITEVKLADGAVTTAKIGADAVTNAKLADNAVQTENIAAGAVETSDIKDAAVTAVKLADDAVTAAKIDSSVAGTGLKQNTTNGSLEVDAASFDGDITSTDLTVTGGDNATFTDVTLDIKADAVTNAKLADNAVQTENIKDGNVTAAKLTAGAGVADRIAIADAAGAVTFSNAIPSGSIAGKDLTAGDGSISIGGTGAGALLKDANVSVATGGITEVKLADGAVTTAKIGADAVTNAKLADNAVQTENIAAGAVETSDIKDVAVTAVKLADDAVTAAKIDSSVAGTGLKQNTTNGSLEVDAASFDGDITSTDLTVTGGDNATFTDVTLDIKADAVTNAKLADNAVQTENIKDGNVTSAKLTAGAGVADRIAIADAAGAVTFSNAIPSGSIAGKDLTAGDGSISIGGTGAGALLKDANVSVATGGITEVKLADGAVTTVKIEDAAVTAVKLADDAVTAAKIDSSVAGTGLKQNTTNGSLEVDAASFDGDITSTDLTVTGGDNATFTDVTLNIKDGAVTTDKIKDENVTAAKLTAGTGVADRIAIADAAGAVTFSNAIPSGSIAGEDLTAGDGSISIGGTGAGALLKDANVSVATGGITEVKLADGAVTTAKIGADAVTNAKLADNAVQTENIAAGAVETSDIKDAAVTAVKLADDAVTAAKIDSSVAGTGLKQNTTNGSLEVDAASFDGDITSTDLTVTGGDNATFTDVTLDIKADAVTNAKLADNAVQTENIKDGNVTSAKLTAGAGTADRIAIADAAGAVTFSNAIPSGSIAGEDLTAGDGSISIGGTGAGALLKDANVSVATGGITEVKLADGAVTTAKIGADAVTNAKLADNAVQTENIKDGAATAIKLNSGAATNGQVATANGTGGVTYQSLTPSMIGTAGEDLTAADASLEVVTGGTDAVLVASSLQVKAGGISTAKLADGAVTNVKLGADAVTTDKIAAGAVETSDLASDAVTNAKLADDAVQTENIKDGAATAIKLNSGAATSGQVATANGTGGVTYQNITPSMIGTAGEDLTAADASLEVVTGGTDAVLVASSLQVKAGGISTAKLADGAVTNVKLGADAVTNAKLADNAVQTENIAAGAVETSDLASDAVTNAKLADDAVQTENIKDGAATAIKLNSGAATSGQVATANGTGGVTYQNITPSMIGTAGEDLTAADASLEVVTGGTDAVLVASSLQVKAGGISTAKLADDAVTTSKLGADAVTNAKLADGAVTNVKLGADAVTTDKIAAGAVETSDLASDAVTNAKLADDAVQTENIKDGAATAIKLNSGAATSGQVATANGTGGVTYQSLTPSMIGTAGENLTAADASLEVVTGGTDAVLVASSLQVKAGGISTAKLADGAVTNVKLDADAVTTDKIAAGAVETSDLASDAVTNAKLADNAVQTENIKDGAATAIKLNSGAASSGQVATANGTGGVTYQSLTPSMIGTAGENLTAADGSLEVVTGGTDAVLVASSLQVKAGGISTAKLADGAVTNVKLGADAVTTDKIAAGAVETSDLASDAVTNSKLADNAVQTENIAAGAVETSDLASDAVTNAKLADDAVQTENIKDGAATAIKLNSGAATSGQVATANGTGGVTYQSLTPSMIGTAGEDLTAADGSLEVVTGGTDAVLVASSLQVKAGGISTAKLADGAVTNVKLGADAVTNAKLADNAVQTENIAAGAVETSDIKDANVTTAKMAPGANDSVMTTNTSGTVEWTDKKTFVSEPWKVQNTTDPATSNSQSIYQQGNVGIGFSSTDAASAHALDVKAGTVRVREVRNNYTPVNTDKVVVADSNGVLRTVNAAMPRVFYMPAVIFDTSSPATGLKRNLYLEYKAQFTGVTFIPNTTTGGSLGGANTGFVKSAGADATIPISVTNTDLMYYITYFDPAVFANLSIDANGVLTYDIIGSGTEASYMNIVFVVK